MSTDLQLDTLEASGLIRLAAARPELQYLFRHWLVQDAAYSSLLKQERRELHRLVGEALETLYPEREPELAAELAGHFELAERRDRAVHYLIEAGGHALQRFAIQEARTFFDRAARLQLDGDTPDQLRQRVEIGLGQVKAGFTFKPVGDELPIVEGVLSAAERLDEPRLLLDVNLWIALLRQMKGERYESSPELRSALDRASEVGIALGDPSLTALPLALTGMSQVFGGDLRAGTATLERAVPLLEQRRAFVGASMAMNALAIGYVRLGEFAQAREAAERAAELAKDGDPIARLDALIIKAIVESMSGDLATAAELAQYCVRTADELGSPACAVASRFVLGDVQLRQGQPELARPTLEEGGMLSFATAFWRPLVEASLGSANAELGDLAKARAAWASALQQAGDRFAQAVIRQQRARALARQPAPPWGEIVDDLEFSTKVFEAAEARPFLAQGLSEYGRVLLALGRAEEGRTNLERAAQVFESINLKKEAGAIRSHVSTEAMPRRHS